VRTFQLTSTHEFFLEFESDEKLVRVEIFSATNERNIFRTRVWLQNTYNLYPTFLNVGPKGEDLKLIHSCDQLNTDITVLIAASPDWITGVFCAAESDFLVMVASKVEQHFQNLEHN